MKFLRVFSAMNLMKNNVILVAKIYRFLAFVRSKDLNDRISFVDKNTFLGREENYKAEIAERARKELSYESWQTSMINTGKIIERCKQAKKIAGNLIYINQQYHFDNIVKNHAKHENNAEKVLYDIYKWQDEKVAFEQAIEVFGAKYDLIAYLFFIKDSSRFLPVSPRNFEKSFASIGFNYELAYKCSWKNYIGFIKIVREIQEIMQDIIHDVDVRLIDAHSFLWIINEKEFREWKPDKNISAEIEQETEKYINAKTTKKEIRSVSYFVRSAAVMKDTKARANGICQLCEKPAPFRDNNGNPYLETHHIVWLSRGGEDSMNNTVALCPNCHAKMHIRDDEADIEKLLRSINAE